MQDAIYSDTSPLTSPTQSVSNKLKNLEKKISKINSLVIFPTEITVFHYISVSMFSSLQVPFTHSLLLTCSFSHALTHLLAQELYLESCPPSTIKGLFSLRFQLKILEITNSGITDLSDALTEGMVGDDYLKQFQPIILGILYSLPYSLTHSLTHVIT